MSKVIEVLEEVANHFGVGLKDLGEYIVAHTTNTPVPSHTAIPQQAAVMVVAANATAANTQAQQPQGADVGEEQAHAAQQQADEAKEPAPTGEGQQ